MRLWKINCEEDKYPGLWQRWFKNQCAAVGWPPGDGWRLDGAGEHRAGWTAARRALQKIEVGDHVVVQLSHHRVGRLGTVTGKEIRDDQWKPQVPKSRSLRHGQMGRLILVRWDLTVGPDDRDMVVALPQGTRLSAGELRPTIKEIRSISVARLGSAMNDPENWIGLLAHFDYERALSGYIAAYPHRLEDGLLPYPDMRVREQVFSDGTRSDVLLIDRDETPVVVECKQWQPTVRDVQQLRKYMRHVRREVGRRSRGILVHGGARKLRADVLNAVSVEPRIEVIQYKLDVDFAPCQ
jgi:hypothetical protein